MSDGLSISFGRLPEVARPDSLSGEDPTFRHAPVTAAALLAALSAEPELTPVSHGIHQAVRRFAGTGPGPGFELGFLEVDGAVRSLHCDAPAPGLWSILARIAAALDRDFLIARVGTSSGACVGRGDAEDVIRARVEAILELDEDLGPYLEFDRD